MRFSSSRYIMENKNKASDVYVWDGVTKRRKSALPHGAVGTGERRRDSQMEEFSR